MKYLANLLPVVALTACISTTAHKASSLPSREICIIHNPAVLHDFGGVLQRQIQAKGYAAKVVQSETCPLMAKYTANYGFHWGVYLSKAEITLLTADGRKLGDVFYQAGYGSVQKHGRVEEKVKSLVEQLLP